MKRIERPKLTNEQRRRHLHEISELASKIRYTVGYLSGCDTDEFPNWSAMDLVDIRYFTKLSLEIEDHANGLFYHYNLDD